MDISPLAMWLYAGESKLQRTNTRVQEMTTFTLEKISIHERFIYEERNKCYKSLADATIELTGA